MLAGRLPVWEWHSPSVRLFHCLSRLAKVAVCVQPLDSNSSRRLLLYISLTRDDGRRTTIAQGEHQRRERCLASLIPGKYLCCCCYYVTQTRATALRLNRLTAAAEKERERETQSYLGCQAGSCQLIRTSSPAWLAHERATCCARTSVAKGLPFAE